MNRMNVTTSKRITFTAQELAALSDFLAYNEARDTGTPELVASADKIAAALESSKQADANRHKLGMSTTTRPARYRLLHRHALR
jgi:hypothetical protein